MMRLGLVVSLAIASVAAAQPAGDGPACAAHDADACFRLGAAAAMAHDDAVAAKRFAAACDAGHGLACVYMGTIYETADAARARWLAKVRPALEKRCKAGDAEHCYYLGIAFERGTGAPVDGRRSLAAYQRACELGFVLACTNLAGNYLKGIGTAANAVKAAEIYTRACRAGDDLACYWLGWIYDGELAIIGDRERLDHVLLGGESADVLDAKRGTGKAIVALVRGADTKALRAGCAAKTGIDCYLLAELTLARGGADAAAADKLRRACDAGNGWGCFTLGDLYARGLGVARDLHEATQLYARVCAHGVGGEANSFAAECQALADAVAISAAH